MAKRRLLVVHPSDEMYGADKVLVEVLSEIADEWEVEVWLPTDIEYPRKELSTKLRAMGHSVLEVPLPVLRRSYLRPSALPALASRFIRTGFRLMRLRPAAVYVSTSALAPVLPLARLAGARAILHLHEYIDPATAKYLLPFLSFAQKVLCVSEAIREPLPEKFLTKTLVIYNGFNFDAEPTPLNVGDQIVCLVASRWNSWKGHETLLSAWDKLCREDMALIVLGAAPTAGESVDVPALVQRLRRKDSVTIVGQTVDVQKYIECAHLVLVPSIKPDPLPTIAIEALAAGRPIMGSDSGGLPEIIGSDAGYLVKTGDVEAWAIALNSLTREGIAERAAEARFQFESKFDVVRFRVEIREAMRS